MAYYTTLDEDVFGNANGNSHFLNPLSQSNSKPRRPGSRQSIHGRKSTASLRNTSVLTNHHHQMEEEEQGGMNGRHSLAHELAAALLPEPSVGSKLLAEEFGLEFDEGAEGIDEPPPGFSPRRAVNGHDNNQEYVDGVNYGAHGLETHDSLDLSGAVSPMSFATEDAATSALEDEVATRFSSSGSERSTPSKASFKQPDQDPLTVLSRELETTDKFLNQLRHLDPDSLSTQHTQPPIERLASDMIRRINDTVRDREGQVRELLECEREFRKISGEVGGDDVLGELDALEEVEDLMDPSSSTTTVAQAHEPMRADSKVLETVQEEDHLRGSSSWNDWETDPDHLHINDHDRFAEPESPSAFKDAFPIPQLPTVNGPVTVAKTIPHLADMRALTSSLVSSLTTVSEHAQVNGTANAEAGRKIRALKNKLGGWRTDWDSAEQSRLRIENWEAGILGDGDFRFTSAGTKLDARKFVEEHLRGFELALADASMKTQAILARS